MGKTNLLDAIYYLCIGKSYFTSSDKNVVRHTADFIRLEGYIDDNKIVNKNLIGKEKTIEIDAVEVTKLSDFVGRFPIVVIAPKDIQSLVDAGDDRRVFINNTIGQYETDYLQNLYHYNRLLKQRNALLKTALEQRTLDHTLLDILTMQMVPYSQKIYDARVKFFDELLPLFIQNYTSINNNAESFELTYKSDLQSNNFEELAQQSKARDIFSGRTNIGIHKDDLIFTIGDRKLKEFGSQGQVKSFVLALKLSQYHLIKKMTNKLPFLLLDDIFDKLDNLRVNHLLKMINDGEFGQIFITDANKHRVNDLLKEYGINFTEIWVENGTLALQ